MAAWDSVPLGELASFRNGVNYSKKNFGEGIPVLGVSNFGDRLLAPLVGLDEIRPDGVVRPEHLLQDNDIIFVRSNGNRKLIGRSLLLQGVDTPVTHSAFTIRLRFESTAAWPRYYSYVFRTDLIRATLSAQGGGTNIVNLNQDILSRLPVPVPPLPTQKRIASILSAYDDLIENNTKRIKILEEMARALYREWFVHFRFPGHENVKLVDSPMGKIPEGWEVVALEDIVTTIIDYRGKTPKKLGGDWSSEGIMALSAKNIKGGGLVRLDQARFVDETLYDRWMKVPLEKHDVLMTSEAPMGELYYLATNECYCLSQRLFALRANPSRCRPAFFYRQLESESVQGSIEARGTGATVKGIRQALLRQVPVMIPSGAIQNQFVEFADPLEEQLGVLRGKNAILRQTRDLLLPKLISGEIDVDTLELPEVDLW